ncbi:MAG: hypothetical protein IPL61_35450 [Myxococcales bacterium]|nr:hypothetical protein [Myxococcales bacterium]
MSLLLVVVGVGRAAADDGAAATLAPTVLTIPTAWTQPGTAIYASGDVDHRGGAGARATLSYARLVDVDVGGDELVTACDPCAGVGRTVTGVRQTSAGWKLSLRPWRGGAVALGVRVPFGHREVGRATEAFAVMSAQLGPVRLHAGASTWASEHRGADGATIRLAPSASVRPLAGLAWTPEIYPRTTILADVQWLPQLGPSSAETAPRWAFAWGVRYRAFSWNAIELGVRHRAGDDLGGATVMVRLSAILSARGR